MFSGEDSDEASDQAVKPNAKGGSGLEGAFPHPKHPTAWNTKVLLLTNEIPPKAKLSGCKQQVDSLSKKARSPESLIAAQHQAIVDVKENQEIYHWCFYKIMADLDDTLLNDHMSMSFQERNVRFLEDMRVLWIIAFSLDDIENDHAYMDYIRTRYVQLSNDFFARNVDVLGNPLSDKTGEFYQVGAPSKPKPAEPADVD